MWLKLGEGREEMHIQLLLEKSLGKWSFERPRRRWEDNIKMNLRNIGSEGERWMKLFPNHTQCRDLIIMLVDITNDVTRRLLYSGLNLPAGRQTSLSTLNYPDQCFGFVVDDITGEKCHPGGRCGNTSICCQNTELLSYHRLR
jgi:hypothetical protein